MSWQAGTGSEKRINNRNNPIEAFIYNTEVFFVKSGSRTTRSTGGDSRLKSRRNKRWPTNTELRRFRNRLVSILSAITVFVTTYAMVLPAISMDDETTAQEPGIELAQPVAEVSVEPAVPEIIAAEPFVAESVVTEPVVSETAVADAAPAETVVQEEVIPAASPEEMPIATPEPAAVEDTDAVQEDKTAEPVAEENGIAEEESAIEDLASEEDAEEAEEETEEEKEENKLAVSPLVFDVRPAAHVSNG